VKRSRKEVGVMIKTFGECKNKKLWQWRKIDGKKCFVKVMDEKICTHCIDFKNCDAFVALSASKMAMSFVNKMKKGGLK